MKLHEYQAKQLLTQAGVPVLPGFLVDKKAPLPARLKKLGPAPWVLKAQVLTGGRGKAGGIKLVNTAPEAARELKSLLGKTLVTAQTGPAGLTVRKVYVEKAAKILREFYVGVTLNRKAAKPTLMVSAEGGVDIETLARVSPEKIRRVDIHPLRGLEPFQARELAFDLDIPSTHLNQTVKVLQAVVKLFLSMDASLVEVNPLGLVEWDGKPTLCALDAKIVMDDNALFRHTDWAEQADEADVTVQERDAKKAGISYIRLDGNIGCLVNGAGLAMATMDIIKLHGGEPANFLDVGGGANAQQVQEAFRILLADKNVRAVFVNIFGGIMKCDVIAQGILQAVQSFRHRIPPIIVRLAGNRVDEGQKLLKESGLDLMTADDLDEGARLAVQATRSSKP
ncbi:MAG TPA: ADP-forming succinate--CoA ligase subunit beta [Elusimicrobiota bacterium]|nr:ADP-forming succinate--CoA ligase subunit beta [Elusimicrobiota bacterium]